MTPCPKCHAELTDAIDECPHCGIVFAKYRERQESLSTPAPALTAVAEDMSDGAGALLRGVESPSSMPVVVGRGVFLALLGIWTLGLASLTVSAENASSFMHLPNLVFHEAGHILFIPFGRFMTVLGGSLTQVLVPLICAGTFLWQTRDAFGAAVAIWWAGQSLTDVAPYINDARALQLVLLGGRTGAEVEGHDWEYLLTTTGLLHRDHAIASAVQAVGTVTMIAAIVWAGMVVINQFKMRNAKCKS